MNSTINALIYIPMFSILAFLQSAISFGEEINISASSELNIRMGQGFTSIGGLEFSQDMAYCVDTAALNTFGTSSGETLSIYIDNISSAETLTSNLSGSVDLSVGFSQIPEGKSDAQKVNLLSASIHGNSKFQHDMTYNSKYTYVFVQVRKTFQTEILSSFSMPIKNTEFFLSRPGDFYNKCGDRFVSGVKKGSEVVAVLRCETQTEDEKNTIDKFIKSNAGYKGFSANGEVTNLINTVKNETQNRCQMLISAAGGSSNYEIKDSNEFIASAIKYVSSSTPSTAKPIDFVTTSYDAIISSDLNSVLEKVDLKLSAQRLFVQSKRANMYELISLIDLIDKSPIDQTPAETAAILGINKISSQIFKCLTDINNPNVCVEDNVSPRLVPGITLKPPHK